MVVEAASPAPKVFLPHPTVPSQSYLLQRDPGPFSGAGTHARSTEICANTSKLTGAWGAWASLCLIFARAGSGALWTTGGAGQVEGAPVRVNQESQRGQDSQGLEAPAAGKGVWKLWKPGSTSLQPAPPHVPPPGGRDRLAPTGGGAGGGVCERVTSNRLSGALGGPEEALHPAAPRGA